MNKVALSTELASFISTLPKEPGIYRMLDKEGVVLYVGKAANLKKRVGSYFTKQNVAAKTRSLVGNIASIEIAVTRSETEALLLESTLIKSLQPKYNVLLRDDKSYPYIHFSDHLDFPRVEIFRSKKKPVGGNFFGPYPSAAAVKATVVTIQKIFKIRNCQDSYFNARSRPCLQYQIKRCTAPCVQYIEAQAYKNAVRNAMEFLQGKSQMLLEELAQRMNVASEQLRFEDAAIIRDQIKSLRLAQEQQGMMQLQGDADVIAITAQPGFACIVCVTVRDGEVLASRNFFPTMPKKNEVEEVTGNDLWQQTFEAFIGFYYLDMPERIPKEIITHQSVHDKDSMQEALSQQRGKACTIHTKPRGIKMRWLDFALNNLRVAVAEYENKHATIKARYAALQKVVQFSQPIQRMECFDVSHTQGEATIASCVVFNQEGPCPKEYRRFNIEGVKAGDDYAAMEQALTRRFKRVEELKNAPDLLLIDGGKGQVAVAQKVLTTLQVQGVTLLGVAKGPARKAGWEKLILVGASQELQLPEDSHALHLIQHIRDEAHRFAITAHRKKRQKARIESSVESIEGIGAKRRQALLQRFGGLRELANASVEELAKVPGISEPLAEKIFQFFH